MENFSQFWPIAVTVVTGIVAISKFYLDWLRIRELRLKIEQLEDKKNNSLIYTPTSEEIRIYSKSLSKSGPVTNVLISVMMVSVISFSIFDYSVKVEMESTEKLDLYKIEIEYLNRKLEMYENVSVKSVGTNYGFGEWGGAVENKFRGELSSAAGAVVVGGINANLVSFSKKTGNHFNALFSVEELSLQIEIEYLLVRGPHKSWFLVSDMEVKKRHNKSN